MKQIILLIFRKFSGVPIPAIADASWEVEYLVQKFCNQYTVYPEQKVREAVVAVFSNTPVPGEVMVKEVRERLEGV